MIGEQKLSPISQTLVSHKSVFTFQENLTNAIKSPISSKTIKAH